MCPVACPAPDAPVPAPPTLETACALRRRTLMATGLGRRLLAVGGVTAAIAADPAPAPPPAIKLHLANGRVPADALAAGPIAGQLDAPHLHHRAGQPAQAPAATALDTGDPELVIVLGGPVAISDHVIDQVETATGLAATDQPGPAGGIVGTAGPDRFATAAAVADLLAAYDPAYLPVTAQAVDADTLDGKQAPTPSPRQATTTTATTWAADGKAQTARARRHRRRRRHPRRQGQLRSCCFPTALPAGPHAGRGGVYDVSTELEPDFAEKQDIAGPLGRVHLLRRVARIGPDSALHRGRR